VLAVRSDPAEAAPKDTVKYTALYADATGTLTTAPIDWAYCEERKPLKELGPVSPLCLQRSADFILPLGIGATASGALPDIACRQFGPDVPQTKPGEPSGRPVDPDTTGGYYQPLRLVVSGDTGDAYTIGENRLLCGLAGATPEAAKDYKDRYRPNTNPAVASLTIVETGAALALDDGKSTNPIGAGQHVTLRAAWNACPDPDVCGDGICGPDETAADCAADCAKPVTCTGAERYVNQDLATRTIIVQHEAMRVSWFATGGGYDLDHTEREAGDLTPSSDDVWTAPSAPGTVHLWVVLRDDRAGVGWQSYVLDVH
jgi:hypothetical protein